MNEILHSPEFWYALCVIAIFLISAFGIKSYLKKYMRESIKEEKNKKDAENRTEN